jgi:hypothetical protein
MKILRRTAPLAVALTLLLAGALRADVAAGRAAISKDELRKTVEKLAGEDFNGREAGTEGGKKAGDWIASELTRFGLKPAGDDGTFFQNFKQGKKSLRNVVATLPARDGSELADETVVIGSHYDHLGLGGQGALDFLSGKGKVHFGADDNASGSAGNLMLAHAFASAGPQKRRIVFIWFDGEELGLFGSKRYVKKPTFPLEKTVLMLNMDMIGRLRKDKLTVYGVNTGSTFPEIVKVLDANGMKLEIKDTMPPNSDHASFYEKKVPVIALFTGLHHDYHSATDTADKVEAGGMERIIRFAFDLLEKVTNQDGRAVFAEAKDGQAEAMLEQLQAMLSDADLEKIFGGEEGLQKLFKESGLGKVMEKLRGPRGSKPRFGVSIDQSEEGVVKVSRVTPGSVAERAGVKEGDAILSLAGREVGDYTGLTAAIRVAEGKVKVIVLRGGEKVELEADFGAPPAAQKKRWF